VVGIYFADVLDVLRAAGCRVAENDTTAGWEYRARSSGGFPEVPLGVFWHHTASSTSPESDLEYMINVSDDAPIGNLLLDRSGTYWPIAAGASNCAGKGGPTTFSRGVVPVDSGNTRGWQVEACNAGTGEAWPVVQIDAFFVGSNALNAHFGNLPTDVTGHAHYTSRKIDPATATSVEGPWEPRSINSSGTWNLSDIRSECSRRAGSSPPPSTGKQVVDMYVIAVSRNGWPGPVDLVVAADGTRWNQNGNTSSLDAVAGVPRLEVDKDQALGVLVDRPGIGPCPFEILPAYFDAELAASW
jgi:hypothetical protein